MMESERRRELRIPVDACFNEYVAERQTLGVILNVSDRGLRVMRVLRAGARPNRIVQVEFELPGTGEVIWAKGETCFDDLSLAPFGPIAAGPSPTIHASGVRLVAAADKHLRLLHDYVVETRRKQLSDAIGRPPDELVDGCAYWSLSA